MPIILAEDGGSETDLGKPCLQEKVKKKKKRQRGEGAGREGEKRQTNKQKRDALF